MKVYPWQQSQWQQLESSIEADRLPHGLLLHGPEGIGLSQFAHALAARLLCESVREGIACGQCRGCALLESGNHPDLRLLEPEEAGKQIKVEQVRELIEFIHLSSQYGRFKVAIIEPADAMNNATANALLKTLEEPPEASVLILNTHLPGRLPITIRSRCHSIGFHLVRDEPAIAWLQDRLQPDQDAAMLLDLAGSPFAALSMIEEDAIQQREAILEDLLNLRGNVQDPVEIAKRWNDFGAGQVIGWLQRLFSDMLKLKIAANPPGLKNADRVERLRRLSNGLDLTEILSCCQLLAKIYAQHSSTISFNTQALLEEFVLRWHGIETRGGVNQ